MGNYNCRLPLKQENTENVKMMLDWNNPDAIEGYRKNGREWLCFHILNYYQKLFNEAEKRNDESSAHYKNRECSYLYKLKYFIKSISYDHKKMEFVIVCYLKPSSSISYMIKGLKTKINHWYTVGKSKKFNLDSNHKDEVLSENIFIRNEVCYQVFNVNSLPSSSLNLSTNKTSRK